MTTAELAKRLCRDLVREVAEWEELSFIVTNFRYPDGDFVNLYIDPNRRSLFDKEADPLIVSDLGTTMFKCRESGIEITAGRQRFIEAICNTYGLKYDSGVLWMQVDRKHPGRDCLAFCEAVTRVSGLEYEGGARYISPIPEMLEILLTKKVGLRREIQVRWTDPSIDPKGSHPVDYRLNGEGEPRHIFTVTNEEKCTTVDAVSHFLRSNGLWVPTLSIIDPRASIGGIFLDRLQRASTEVKEGVKGFEDDIVQFALSGLNGGSKVSETS